MSREWSLEGKVVAITGAYGGHGRKPGLGERTALRLIQKGAKPFLIDISPDVEDFASKMGCRSAVADVTDLASMEQAAEKAIAEMGQVDIVFANAGIADYVTFEGDPEVFYRVMKVNLFGVFHTIRVFMPQVRENKGYFLTNASMGAIVRLMTMAEAYGASKAAAAVLGHVAELELIGTGAKAGTLYIAEHDSQIEDKFHDSIPQEFMRNNPALRKSHKARDPEKAVDVIISAMENRSRYAFAPSYTAGGAFAPMVINDVTRRMHVNVQPTVERVRSEYQAKLEQSDATE